MPGLRALLTSACLLVATTTSLEAQDPRAAMTAEAVQAMQRFQWLAGEWEGPASIQNAGRSFQLTQHEQVNLAARSTALLIEGRGRMKTSPNGPEQEVFGAAGVLTYDAGQKKYRFFSTGGTGQAGESKVETVGENGLVWSMGDAGLQRTRYTITRTTTGAWYEKGETSTDGGATWSVILEMTLTRLPARTKAP